MSSEYKVTEAGFRTKAPWLRSLCPFDTVVSYNSTIQKAIEGKNVGGYQLIMDCNPQQFSKLFCKQL